MCGSLNERARAAVAEKAFSLAESTAAARRAALNVAPTVFSGPGPRVVLSFADPETSPLPAALPAAAAACRLCASDEACANAADAGDAIDAEASAIGRSAPTYRGSRLPSGRVGAPPSLAPPAPGGDALPGEFAPLPARLLKRVLDATDALSCALWLSPVMPNFSSENVGRVPSGCVACGTTSSLCGLTNADAPSRGF